MAIGPPQNVAYNRTTGLLSWSATPGADRYLVMEKTQLQQPRLQIASTAATSHAVGTVGDGELRVWVVIPFDDFAGVRGIPSRAVRTAGARRKFVNQDPVIITSEDVLFGDSEPALFGDGEAALFGD